MHVPCARNACRCGRNLSALRPVDQHTDWQSATALEHLVTARVLTLNFRGPRGLSYIVPRTGVADTCQTHYGINVSVSVYLRANRAYALYCPQDRAGTDVQTHKNATKAPLTGCYTPRPGAPHYYPALTRTGSSSVCAQDLVVAGVGLRVVPGPGAFDGRNGSLLIAAHSQWHRLPRQLSNSPRRRLRRRGPRLLLCAMPASMAEDLRIHASVAMSHDLRSATVALCPCRAMRGRGPR
jgi:hypothetical protein